MAQLHSAGYSAYAALTLTELLDHYVATGRVDAAKSGEIRAHLQATRLTTPATPA